MSAFEGATESEKPDWDRANVPAVGAVRVRDAALSLLAARHTSARAFSGRPLLDDEEERDNEEERALGLLAGETVTAAVLCYSGESLHEDLQLDVDSSSLVKQFAGITIVMALAASIAAVLLGLGIWESFFFVAIAIVPAIAIWNFWAGRQFTRHGVVPSVAEAAALPTGEAWIAVDARTYWGLADGGYELRKTALRDGAGVILVDSNLEARFLIEATMRTPGDRLEWAEFKELDSEHVSQ